MNVMNADKINADKIKTNNLKVKDHISIGRNNVVSSLVDDKKNLTHRH